MGSNLCWTFLLTIAWAVLYPTSAVGQQKATLRTGGTGTAREAAKSPTFDVVSIRPHQRKPGEWARTGFTPDGFTSTNTPLYVVLVFAYDLHDPTLIGTQPGGHLSRIPGAPEWAYSDFYDIAAKMSDSDIEELKGLSRDERNARMRSMLQALLADRFDLKVRAQTKDAPAFDLVVASRGPKNMKKEPDSETPHLDWRGRTHLAAHAFPISELAKPILTAKMGCPVEDKTGLMGRYDFTLDWSVDEPEIAGPASSDAAPPEFSGPSIFTALQEQIGLKLVPTKVPMESIVIDHVDRPSEN